MDTEDRLVKATREYLSGERRDQVGSSLAEIIDQVDKALPPDFRPVYDRERMAGLAGANLHEYVKSGNCLLRNLARLLTERGTVLRQILEKVKRFDFDLDPDWAALDEVEQAIMPADCDSYPGLVRFRNYLSVQSARARVKINGSGSKLRELSSEYHGLSGAAILIRYQLYSKAFEALEAALPKLDFDADAKMIIALLTLLLAAEQTAYVRRLFEDEEFAEYRFKDRFKPHYFALLAELGESRADDFKRMVPELKETVDEIRAQVLALKHKYFDNPAQGPRGQKTTRDDGVLSLDPNQAPPRHSR
jgi:hypothetical protein